MASRTVIIKFADIHEHVRNAFLDNLHGDEGDIVHRPPSFKMQISTETLLEIIKNDPRARALYYHGRVGKEQGREVTIVTIPQTKEFSYLSNSLSPNAPQIASFAGEYTISISAQRLKATLDKAEKNHVEDFGRSLFNADATATEVSVLWRFVPPVFVRQISVIECAPDAMLNYIQSGNYHKPMIGDEEFRQAASIVDSWKPRIYATVIGGIALGMGYLGCKIYQVAEKLMNPSHRLEKHMKDFDTSSGSPDSSASITQVDPVQQEGYAWRNAVSVRSLSSNRGV